MQFATRVALPPDEGLARRRAQRLHAFLKMIAVVTALTLVAFAVFGSAVAAIGSTLMLLASLCSLVALSRGAKASTVVVAFLGVSVLVQGTLGVLRGSSGLPSLFWLTMVPAVALGVGGRKAGARVLLGTVAVDVIALLAINRRWVEPVLENQLKNYNGIAPVASAVCGMCVTFYLIARWYDGESERTISEVIRRNDELSTARREADEANRAKSDFLATISHEIRTPLNGVLGMTAALLDDQHSAKTVEGLRLIQRSGHTLRSVINDVLDFSKIESSQLTLEAMPVNAADELRLVAELLTPQAELNDDVLAIEVEPNVPTWFIGDPTRVRQVMLNLISNAVKFTSHGRIELRLSYTAGVLRFSVTDSGIGMSLEAQKRVFVPFVQADSSTTRRFGGSGLGLVISQRLVQAMQGTISLRSVEGEGTEFTAQWPVEITSAPARNTPVEAIRCEPKRVLLVEDNEVNQIVAARLIERLGHEIVIASNGAEALVQMTGTHFDIVLMDCHMPVLDGFDATKQLRARGLTLPIVALTAAASSFDHARCLDAGMNEVITKPIHPDTLARILGRSRSS